MKMRLPHLPDVSLSCQPDAELAANEAGPSVAADHVYGFDGCRRAAWLTNGGCHVASVLHK